MLSKKSEQIEYLFWCNSFNWRIKFKICRYV